MIQKVKSQIKNNEDFIEYNSKLIKNNNRLLYKEENTKVSLTILKDEIILRRENEESISNFLFKKNLKSILNYTLKKENLSFKTLFDTDYIKIFDNEIIISYSIDDNKFIYSLLIEEEI